jgi:TetR/AcrR family transcriptional repressor of nem operon
LVWYKGEVPRDAAATRDRILAAAQRLMVDQGYNATSLDQVLAESSSSKGAFFHHFRSKADLANHLVARYVDDDLGQLQAGLDSVAHLEDPTQRVLAFLRFFEDGADELMSETSGCLYATVLAERELVGGKITDLVAGATLVWRRELVALLRPALRQAGVRIDVDALADHLYTTFEGAFILARTLDDQGAMKAQLRVLRQLVERLLVSPTGPA